jgi:hypothetical protein
LFQSVKRQCANSFSNTSLTLCPKTLRAFSPLALSHPLRTPASAAPSHPQTSNLKPQTSNRPAPRCPKTFRAGRPPSVCAVTSAVTRTPALKFASRRRCTMQPPGCSHDASLATRGGRAKRGKGNYASLVVRCRGLKRQ